MFLHSLSLPEHILSQQKLIKHKARAAEGYILVKFSSSVSTLQWYVYSITVWSRAARRRIRLSTSHFNNYKLPEYKERRTQHKEWLVKLTDNNKHCVIRICIHPGLRKSNCPWNKKTIPNTSHSLGHNLYFWSWMQMNQSLHSFFGFSDSKPELNTKSCSHQTSSTRQSGIAGFSLWNFSAFYRQLQWNKVTEIMGNCLLHMFNTYSKLADGRTGRKRKRRRKRKRQTSLLE